MRKHFRRIPGLARLARWVRRARRVRKLERAVDEKGPLCLVVGSAGIAQPGWLETDRDFLDLLDERHWRRRLREGSVAAIVAEHVWEHLTEAQALDAARRCHRYLKPGGHLRIAVPDGLHPSPDYRDQVRPGGTGSGADDHKVLYDHARLARLFEAAGFRVELLEYFDAEGRFHGRPWNVADGFIRRSKQFDPRNRSAPLRYTSIILDAHKEADDPGL